MIQLPNGAIRVAFAQQLSLTNKWAGMISHLATSCRYAVKMQARVIQQVGGSRNGGYGIAIGRLNSNSLPDGLAFQYDFGFSGYRVLTYPDDWQKPYRYVLARLDHKWHRIEVVFTKKVTAYVDGRLVISQPATQMCGRPIIRVWSATVEFRDVRADKL